MPEETDTKANPVDVLVEKAVNAAEFGDAQKAMHLARAARHVAAALNLKAETELKYDR